MTDTQALLERLRNPDAPANLVRFDAADTIETLLRQLAMKDEALRHARDTFIRYAKLHRAKATDEGDEKACANASLAEEMHRALTLTDADEQEIG